MTKNIKKFIISSANTVLWGFLGYLISIILVSVYCDEAANLATSNNCTFNQDNCKEKSLSCPNPAIEKKLQGPIKQEVQKADLISWIIPVLFTIVGVLIPLLTIAILQCKESYRKKRNYIEIPESEHANRYNCFFYLVATTKNRLLSLCHKNMNKTESFEMK